MNEEKRKLVETIDNWVNGIVKNSDSEEQAEERILESMYDYMPMFKQVMDSSSQLQMNLLVTQYDGFYRFANLLERMAEAIRDGRIQVPKDDPFNGQPRKKRPAKPKRKRK